MPVLVVGADTVPGEAVIRALGGRHGEIRAFVTDPGAGLELKKQGIKVATGDVSDASHVSGAATSVFSAVLVSHATGDARERSFADSPVEVARAWAEALRDAGVRRIIWLGPRSLAVAAGLDSCAPEFAAVETDNPDAAAREAAELDERASL